MKIVIDIPDTYYEYCKAQEDAIEIQLAVKNGTPLPEHHGRLIDADELKRTMEKDMRRALSFVDLTDFVWLAPTIIEGSDSE